MYFTPKKWLLYFAVVSVPIFVWSFLQYSGHKFSLFILTLHAFQATDIALNIANGTIFEFGLQILYLLFHILGINHRRHNHILSLWPQERNIQNILFVLNNA